MLPCLMFSWTQYMNQTLSGGDVGGTSTSTDSWMRAFSGMSSGEVDATRCRSLTTISVSDLDQLDSYPARASYDPSPTDRVEEPAAAGTFVPDSTTAVERHRLSGLPLKHRYKQTTKNHSTISCQRL